MAMDDRNDLTADVRRFVLKYVNSVAELEALILLAGRPQSPWAVSELASRLYVDRETARSVLDALCHRGLVVAENDTYRYRPVSETLARGVDLVMRSYPRFLIEITHL